MTPGIKKKLNFIAHLQDTPIHILMYHLSIPWNVDGVQVTSLIWQKTSLCHCSTLIWSLGAKNSKSLLRICKTNLSYPRGSIVYSWKCSCSSSDKLYRKMETFFDPHSTPRDKMKIPKPYCICTRLTLKYPRVSFLKSLKCRWSSSDKLFFRKDGRTDRIG